MYIEILSKILKEWNMLILTRCVSEFMQIGGHTLHECIVKKHRRYGMFAIDCENVE